MLERLHHQITGTVRFSLTGDPARFLTACARRGVPLWDFARREDGAALSCRPADYRRLRSLARRCGVKMRLESKRGLPFRLMPLRRRPGLLLGIPCGVAVFWLLSGFVWGVRVAGGETLGDGVILEAARQNGVYLGVRRDAFSPKIAAHGLVGDLEELEWASVNTDGCFVEVAVREGTAAPEITDDSRWSNIVAAREGTVTAIEAERGRPEVRLGDTVAAGDLLIAGLYWEKLDPWSPSPAPLRTIGAARGRVEARTYREFTVHVSARKKEWVPTGERRVRRTLELFGQSLPLGWNLPPEGESRTFTVTRPLTVLGVTLPAAVREETWELLEERTRELSREEMETAALWKLRQAQRAEIAEGGRVEKEELTWVFPDGLCLLTARCRCREEIGVVQEILVKEPKENENF